MLVRRLGARLSMGIRELVKTKGLHDAALGAQ
jgi:hypothetical protein